VPALPEAAKVQRVGPILGWGGVEFIDDAKKVEAQEVKTKKVKTKKAKTKKKDKT
jgi:hypothetical protein